MLNKCAKPKLLKTPEACQLRSLSTCLSFAGHGMDMQSMRVALFWNRHACCDSGIENKATVLGIWNMGFLVLYCHATYFLI